MNNSHTAGIEQNKFDLASIGRPFIANPDLIHKLENEMLNEVT